MKTTLYFTVTKNTAFIGNDEYCDGIKTICVYEIANDKPNSWFDLEVPNDDNSIESIEQYLNDNGFSDKDYEFIQL